jgi:hypothetical protein
MHLNVYVYVYSYFDAFVLNILTLYFIILLLNVNSNIQSWLYNTNNIV